MRRLVLVVLGALLLASGAGAAGGTQLWLARYDGGVGASRGWAVAPSPDGARVYVTGTSLDAFATIAYDAATGAQLWAARYRPPIAGSAAGARALVVSPDGRRVYATGGSTPGASGMLTTVTYDAATGAELWAARGGGSSAAAIGISPDGARVFATGTAARPHGLLDYATVASDAASGARIWSMRYDGPKRDDDYASALAVGHDRAHVFVTGTSVGVGTTGDYATVAYDAATGAERWVARYDGPAVGPPKPSFDSAAAIGVAAHGTRVFVTGKSTGLTFQDELATVAYDAGGGAQLWAARADDGLRSTAAALGVSPDGTRVYVAGEVDAAGTGSSQVRTVAYDAADGSAEWTAGHDNARGGSPAIALAVGGDGRRLYIAARGSGPGFQTVAYAAGDGSEAWTADGAPGEPAAVAVSPDGGRVFVTGAGSDTKYLTIAYDTGAVAVATSLSVRATADGDTLTGAATYATTTTGCRRDGNLRFYLIGLAQLGGTPNGRYSVGDATVTLVAPRPRVRTEYEVTAKLVCTSTAPGRGQITAAAGPVRFTVSPRTRGG